MEKEAARKINGRGEKKQEKGKKVQCNGDVTVCALGLRDFSSLR